MKVFLDGFSHSRENNAWKAGWESEFLREKFWISLGFLSSWRNLNLQSDMVLCLCGRWQLELQRTPFTFVFCLHLPPFNFYVFSVLLPKGWKLWNIPSWKGPFRISPIL